MNISSVIGALCNETADFLFPMYCISCGTSISNRDNCVCESCFSKISPVIGGCEYCSGRIVDGRCSVCSDRMWYIDKNICVAEYSGVMKEVIKHYKFHKRKRIHKRFTRQILEVIEHNDIVFDFVTPVPMNNRKKWERGFNQSELLAGSVARIHGKHCRSVLKEKNFTGSQKEMGYRERFLHILDRYEVTKPAVVKDKNVLLIDDVLTTGATINECGRILKNAGAHKVFSVTIARADPGYT
ncbi:MAG TPA: ComF family protein [Spirochaetota bacterium]|nr:ComF family protein [Spirochaetota bacterium]